MHIRTNLKTLPVYVNHSHYTTNSVLDRSHNEIKVME